MAGQLRIASAFIALSLALGSAHAQSGTLKTRWAKDVSPKNAHPEYPRPQMKRGNWMNLNGLWDFAITKTENPPNDRDRHGQILVPFPVESQLSGVHQAVHPTDYVWYRRTFKAPALNGGRLLLNFGAVDWQCKVWVNNQEVGEHKGGYDPFTFDITSALEGAGSQTVVVRVQDPTDSTFIPRGKQVQGPGGIFYTSTTGIWQTVWLERVPQEYIHSVHVTADMTGKVQFRLSPAPSKVDELKVQVLDGSKQLAAMSSPSGRPITIAIPNVKLWSPRNPKLYNYKITLKSGDSKDEVSGYFAFRTVALGKDDKGRTTLTLNGKPTFMVGPLDQGFWPDGLYTAPTEEAMVYDLKVTKDLGFNMIRKHVKVEPQTWYTWCDKMGILILQDMPSGDRSIGPDDPDIERSQDSQADYMSELGAMIDHLDSHPCIVAWVPFNEGWGQWNVAGVTNWIRKADPTRLIDSTTGWADRGVGDMIDWHVYPGPGAPEPEANRASVLGEFGGLGLPVESHMWQEKGWGYQSYKTREELTDAMVSLFKQLRFLQADPGVSAAVYTQTTDVETELNGLMTYDRAMIKPDASRVRAAVLALFNPPPVTSVLVPTSESSPLMWRYVAAQPQADWMTLGFDASKWPEAPAGFGTAGTPGAVMRTEWAGKDIWMRRTFSLDSPIQNDGNLYLRIHHDDAAEVYMDGKLIAKLGNWTTNYSLVPITKEALGSLSAGEHVLAMHVHQDEGGQYADVGLVISKG